MLSKSLTRAPEPNLLLVWSMARTYVRTLWSEPFNLPRLCSFLKKDREGVKPHFHFSPRYELIWLQVGMATKCLEELPTAKAAHVATGCDRITKKPKTKAFSEDHVIVLRTFRFADLQILYQQLKRGLLACHQSESRHGNMFMKYAPHRPDYFYRSGVVLLNGHTCLFSINIPASGGLLDDDIRPMKV